MADDSSIRIFIDESMEQLFNSKFKVHGLILELKRVVDDKIVDIDDKKTICLIINMSIYMIKFCMIKFTTTFDDFLDYKNEKKYNIFMRYPTYYPCDSQEHYDSLIESIIIMQTKLLCKYKYEIINEIF